MGAWISYVSSFILRTKKINNHKLEQEVMTTKEEAQRSSHIGQKYATQGQIYSNTIPEESLDVKRTTHELDEGMVDSEHDETDGYDGEETHLGHPSYTPLLVPDTFRLAQRSSHIGQKYATQGHIYSNTILEESLDVKRTTHELDEGMVDSEHDLESDGYGDEETHLGHPSYTQLVVPDTFRLEEETEIPSDVNDSVQSKQPISNADTDKDRNCLHGHCKLVLKAIEEGRIHKVKQLLVKGSPCEIYYKMCINDCLKREDLDITMILLWQLCKEIEKREGSNAVQVYPSYRLEDPWLPVIILLEKKISRGKWEEFKGCFLYRRRYNLVSSEAAKIMSSEEVKKFKMDPKKKTAISTALKSRQLNLSHSNITLISTSTVRSQADTLKREDCIVIGCLVKHFIPFNEKPLPKQIATSEGPVAVDVREAFCTLSMNTENQYSHSTEPKANTFNEKLLIGTEIRRIGTLETGTLGGFVKLDEEKVGFLTCAHAVLPDVDETQPRQEYLNALVTEYDVAIVQPGSCFQNGHDNKCEHSRVCGRVVKFAFDNGSDDRPGIDAAVVRIRCRQAEPHSFVKVDEKQLKIAGYNKDKLPVFYGETMEVNAENEVLKIGAKSGLTTGIIVSDDTSSYKPTTSKITMPNGHISELKHLIEVEAADENSAAFGTGGDSGALVFTKDANSLKCIGMLVSTTSYGSACVIPIHHILQELGVEMFSRGDGNQGVNVECTEEVSTEDSENNKSTCVYL